MQPLANPPRQAVFFPDSGPFGSHAGPCVAGFQPTGNDRQLELASHVPLNEKTVRPGSRDDFASPIGHLCLIRVIRLIRGFLFLTTTKSDE